MRQVVTSPTQGQYAIRLGLAGLALSLMAACAPDYVYIQDGKSEGDVRQDYIGCAEQQFKVFNNTSECMERKGYRAVKIEGPSPSDDHLRRSSTSHAFLP